MSSKLYLNGAAILPEEQQGSWQLLRHPVHADCSLPVKGCTPKRPKQG